MIFFFFIAGDEDWDKAAGDTTLNSEAKIEKQGIETGQVKTMLIILSFIYYIHIYQVLQKPPVQLHTEVLSLSGQTEICSYALEALIGQYRLKDRNWKYLASIYLLPPSPSLRSPATNPFPLFVDVIY